MGIEVKKNFYYKVIVTATSQCGAECANYSFNTSSIARLPSEVSASFCCCKGKLCNCDQNSSDSADYCIHDDIFTWFHPTPTITSRHSIFSSSATSCH